MSHSKASPEWKFQSPAAHAKEDNKAECEQYDEYEEEDDDWSLLKKSISVIEIIIEKIN